MRLHLSHKGPITGNISYPDQTQAAKRLKIIIYIIVDINLSINAQFIDHAYAHDDVRPN
jgi:hypothetical protein